MIKLSSLKPLENNPFKKKDDDQIKKIGESIKSFERMMSIRKIIIDENNEILGGNKRFFALKKLGYKEIPDEWVEQVVDLTEEQKKEFIVKDNSHWGSEWDTELLREWNVDCDAWGIPDVKWAEEKLEAEEDNFEVPDIIETDIVIGDLFEIGEHKLLCGDSTDSDMVAKLMNGEKADMAFTDPPFDLENLSFTDNLFLFTIGHIFILNSEQRNVDISAKHRNNLIRWYAVDFRQANLISNNMPMTRVDFIAEFRNSEKVKFYNQHKGFSTLLQIAKIHSSKVGTIHKQEKKVELPYVFIEHFSKTDEICLDLFLGSGTTMVASHQLKRKCYGMELEPKFCQIIVDRMKKLDSNLTIKKNGNII